MEKKHKYWKLTPKGGGEAIILITNLENEKVIERLKDEFDIEEIPENPELLKNAKPITLSAKPTSSEELTLQPKFYENDPFLPSFKERQRKEKNFQKQQHKYAARQGGWKKK